MSQTPADEKHTTARRQGVRSALAVARRAMKGSGPIISRVALAAMAAASVLGTISCVPTWGPPAPPATEPEVNR